jgi:hypothetical protein
MKVYKAVIYQDDMDELVRGNGVFLMKGNILSIWTSDRNIRIPLTTFESKEPKHEPRPTEIKRVVRNPNKPRTRTHWRLAD